MDCGARAIRGSQSDSWFTAGVDVRRARNIRILARRREQRSNLKAAKFIFRFTSLFCLSESSRIVCMEQRMSVAYSTDLRVRVIEAVNAGASRREAAEWFGISVSSAIRWLREWLDGGRAAAKPRGGSCSPLEEHATWLLALIEERPDLTLEEVVAAMGKQGIEGSRTAVWRFFERHDVSFKKKRYTPASKTELM